MTLLKGERQLRPQLTSRRKRPGRHERLGYCRASLRPRQFRNFWNRLKTMTLRSGRTPKTCILGKPEACRGQAAQGMCVEQNPESLAVTDQPARCKNFQISLRRAKNTDFHRTTTPRECAIFLESRTSLKARPHGAHARRVRLIADGRVEASLQAIASLFGAIATATTRSVRP